jgi:hypothetical protein
MCADEYNGDDFEDAARSIARELSEFVERAMGNFDSEQLANTFGFDPDRAREWVESAGNWLSSRVEQFGDEVASRQGHEPAAEPPDEPSPAPPHKRSDADDPLRGAAPHPLDLPTEEQGAALAALDSGRWTVEPGSRALASAGAGPGPSDALGLVRELRVRDWIDADGAVTLVGRNALKRWLES